MFLPCQVGKAFVMPPKAPTFAEKSFQSMSVLCRGWKSCLYFWGRICHAAPPGWCQSAQLLGCSSTCWKQMPCPDFFCCWISAVVWQFHIDLVFFSLSLSCHPSSKVSWPHFPPAVNSPWCLHSYLLPKHHKSCCFSLMQISASQGERKGCRKTSWERSFSSLPASKGNHFKMGKISHDVNWLFKYLLYLKQLLAFQILEGRKYHKDFDWGKYIHAPPPPTPSPPSYRHVPALVLAALCASRTPGLAAFWRNPYPGKWLQYFKSQGVSLCVRSGQIKLIWPLNSIF